MDRTPSELIREIIKYSACDDTRNLTSFSLSSKRYHALVEPFLYSTIGTSAKVLRSLLENPSLAQCIAHYGTPSKFETSEQLADCISFTKLRIAVKNVSPSKAYATRWLTRLRLPTTHVWDPLTALILSLAPNVKSMDFFVNSSDAIWAFRSIDYLREFLSRASQLQSKASLAPHSLSLSRLEYVRFHRRFDSRYRFLPLNRTFPYFALPSVKHFSGDFLGRGLHIGIPTSTLNITHLSLTNSLAEPSTVMSILKHCPHLKIFEYTTRSSRDFAFPTYILSGLFASKDILEQLVLLDENSDRIGLSISPLSSLGTIKKLVISSCGQY